MNYKLQKVTWENVAGIAKEMYVANTFLTPYSDYVFLSSIRKECNIKLKKEFKKCYFNCFALVKNEKPIIIAPLFINPKRKRIYLLGHFNSVGHIDFLYYDNVEFVDFDKLFSLLSSIFTGFTLVVDRIGGFSKTYNYFISKEIRFYQKETCVKIDFESHSNWFSSLPKGHRQNIRTAYNRINREKRNLCFKFFLNEKPDKYFYRKHISLFSRRIVEHSRLSKLFYYPIRFLKLHDSFSKALLEYPNKIFAGLFLDGTLIASLSGVLSNDERAIITRLSINKDFGVFCPGGLLINETIKKISEEKYDCIKSLDLSRGDEKYKYTYGGKDHYNYSFRLFFNEKNEWKNTNH